MDKKSFAALVMGILGIAFVASAVIMEGRISDMADGMLIGIGAGLTGLGISRWCFWRWTGKEPAKYRQYEVEAGDERNVAIRNKAKAEAGDVLQWMVMAAAWAAILLGAPMWVILAAVGIFLCKTILEMYLMARYQKRM